MRKEDNAKDTKNTKVFKGNKKRKPRTKFVPSPRYPAEVSYAFRNNHRKCRLFMKTLNELSQGRHILDKSPLDVYELKNGYNARKRALCNIFGLENSVQLDLLLLEARDIYGLSNIAYEMLYDGIVKRLNELDLNCYISVEKVINAGNAIKNYNGIQTFGGSTIRDFLTHAIEKEQISSKADEYRISCKNTISLFISKADSYRAIKSIPFSIFRYSNYLKVDTDGKIIGPDIEAKSNICRIIGKELYDSAPFAKLSMLDATMIENKLISTVHKLAAEELKRIYDLYKDVIPECKLKHQIEVASHLSSVSLVSDYGLIHDIVDYFENNIKAITKLEQEPKRILTSEERKALFQIEYTATRTGEGVDISSDMIWIADFADALNSEYATYGVIKTVIEYGFIPKVNDMYITAYNIDPEEFEMIMCNAKTVDRPVDFIEENLQMLLG